MFSDRTRLRAAELLASSHRNSAVPASWRALRFEALGEIDSGAGTAEHSGIRAQRHLDRRCHGIRARESVARDTRRPGRLRESVDPSAANDPDYLDLP
jgi:hypothetical protein